ncbi:MAG: hypothetical protein JWN36_3026, partial [Microbacteriaceae bacterium]|nr:hypothetical protein [Microbacteriaceae bacterium]
SAAPSLVSAPAAEGDITWTVRTASNSFGSDRTSYSYTATPGSTVDDALVVTNHGSDPLDLGVYAADGYTTGSGQFDLVVGGAKSVTIGAWVTSSAKSVAVAPGATVEVPFTLTVPKNATPGDYAGGIVTSLVEPDAAKGINVDRRLGIRVALRVSGDLKPALAVENAHVDWSGGFNPFAGGDATLTYTIHNTGNSMLSAQQAAAVTGPFGWFAAKAGTIAPSPRLLPGEKWKVTVPVHGVAAAVWLAATTTVTPVATDAAGSTSPMTPISVTANGWAVPWTLVVLVLLVAAAVVFLPRLLRRARARRKEREDARVRDAVARALETATD